MTDQPMPLHLGDPGELIATMPHLLGFYPTDSLVLLTLTGEDDACLDAAVRADLPPAEDPLALAERLLLVAGPTAATAAILVVISDNDGESMPHQALVDLVTLVLTVHGLPVRHAVWAASTGPHSAWRHYDDSHYSGEVPAIDATALATFSTADRPTIRSDHNVLVALVAADDEPALSQRAGRIAHALDAHRRHIPGSGRQRLRDDIATVWSAVETMAAGQHELTEDDIVRLTAALTHGEVRAACLGRSRDQHTAAAEELWRRLTQAVPTPYRAEPAVLLAFAAYLRGDGGLAGIALDIARQAQPNHRVAKLLRRSLDIGLSPHRLGHIVAVIAAEAERLSTTDDAG